MPPVVTALTEPLPFPATRTTPSTFVALAALVAWKELLFRSSITTTIPAATFVGVGLVVGDGVSVGVGVPVPGVNVLVAVGVAVIVGVGVTVAAAAPRFVR